MARTVKVAVVGTGLAGLTAAHLLTKEREDDDVDFEVHLFEKAATIGMDSSSVSISTSAQSKGSVEWRIDVPMRSFQGGYYNNLIALYKSLGVKFRQADFSYSFSSLSFGSKRASSSERSITTTMIYNGGSGRAGVGKPSMLDAQPTTKGSTQLRSFLPRLSSTGLFLYLTLQLVLCYLITLYHSLPVWRPADIPEITFAEWTKRTTPRSYLARLCRLDVAWKEYVQTVLIPLVSAVCTSPAEDVINHPIEEVLDYVWLTFGTHHYVVVGGVRKVVEALTANVKHQHLSSPIVSIKPDPSDSACVTIVCLSNGELTEYSGFHHIVMATQASGAATILTSYLDSISQSDSTQRTDTLEQLISSLQAFEYRSSVVINHTDGTLLPDNTRDARDLNLITLAQDSPKPSKPATEVAPFCVTPSYTMATHVLPRPAGYLASQPTVYQSTNPIIAPNVNNILSAATLERAIVTTKSKKALEGLCVSGEKRWWQVPYHARTHLGPLQGASALAEGEKEKEKGNGGPAIWICGSYAHLGIPLLEGCVVSARNVVEEGIFAREGVRREEASW